MVFTGREGKADEIVVSITKAPVHNKQVAAAAVAVAAVAMGCVCRVSSEQSLSVLVITETALS